MAILIITEEESAHMYVREIIEKFSPTNMKIFLSSPIQEINNSCEVISEIPSLRSFGIVEVLSSLTPHYKKMGEMVDFVKKHKPDSVLLIDYGGYIQFYQKFYQNLLKFTILYLQKYGFGENLELNFLLNIVTRFSRFFLLKRNISKNLVEI